MARDRAFLLVWLTATMLFAGLANAQIAVRPPPARPPALELRPLEPLSRPLWDTPSAKGLNNAPDISAQIPDRKRRKNTASDWEAEFIDACERMHQPIKLGDFSESYRSIERFLQSLFARELVDDIVSKCFRSGSGFLDSKPATRYIRERLESKYPLQTPFLPSLAIAPALPPSALAGPTSSSSASGADWIWLITAIPLLITVIFLLVFALNYLLFRDQTLAVLLTKTIYRGLVIPPQQGDRGEITAAARRDFLRANVRFDDQDALPIFAVREVPPAGIIRDRRQELSRPSAIAHRETLRWQLEQDSRLLLGRTIDAVAWILDDVGLSHKVSTIRLVKVTGFLGRYLRSVGLSPYIVQIESEVGVKGYLKNRLAPIADWFGIGVCLAPVRELTEFAEGQIGGSLREHDRKFFVTCSHCVDAHPANSVFFRSELAAHTFQPDVALLACADESGKHRHFSLEVEPIDEDPWLKGADRLVRRPGGRGVGYTFSTAGWARYSGRVHEFPHILVSAHVRVILDAFAWPPWRKLFSGPGDSGSFVIDADHRRWAGLLVAGAKHHKITYAAIALPLLRFLTLQVHLGQSVKSFTEED